MSKPGLNLDVEAPDEVAGVLRAAADAYQQRAEEQMQREDELSRLKVEKARIEGEPTFLPAKAWQRKMKVRLAH